MMLIFRATIDQLVASFNGIMNTGILEDWYAVGGGIIGGIFAIILISYFLILVCRLFPGYSWDVVFVYLLVFLLLVL